MIKHRPIAGLVLAAAIVLTLGAYPFRGEVLGGLFFHIGAAATIGGLADWFAVTALFTKPLGISYHTAVIPRNRDRFVEMAQSMLSDELLRVPYMYHMIKREGLLARFLNYVLAPKGQDQVKGLMGGLQQEVLAHIEWTPVRKELQALLVGGLGQWRLVPILLTLGRRLLQRDTMVVLWPYLNRSLQRLLASESFHPFLVSILEDVVNSYGSTSMARGFLVGMADSLSPDVLARKVESKALAFLKDNESLDSKAGLYVWQAFNRLVDELEYNVDWQVAIESKKNLWLGHLMESWGQKLASSTLSRGQVMESLFQKAMDWGRYLQAHPDKQEPVERFMLLRLVPLLQKLHGYIGSVIGQELSQYSGQAMSQMVRERVGYDLQMIRVNGSLVGAFLGGLLYAVTLLCKEVI